MARPLNHDDHPRLRRCFSVMGSFLPPLNFITIHYAYFIVVCLVASLVFWGSSTPAWSIGYVDALFLVVSAMTEAGLNTVNLSECNSWQQTMLFLLITFGGSIWVSIWTVLARKRAFERRFRDIVRAERSRRLSQPNTSFSGLAQLRRLVSFRSSTNVAQSKPEATAAASGPGSGTTPVDSDVAEGTQLGEAASAGHIVFVDPPNAPAEGNTAVASSTYHAPNTLMRRSTTRTVDDVDREKSRFAIQHFLTKRTVGRNAQFYGLTREEREHLGGCEYRALKLLAVIVPLYFVLWHLLGCIALGAWINNNLPSPPLQNGINPWWLGIFNGASAFNNSGMSLLDANMIPFQNSPFVLIAMGLMILAGNTAYPIFLRLIIWTLLKVCTTLTGEDEFADLKETFRFILKYPRRVYTNLFPSRPTWWLLFMIVLLNSVDWVAFELLNLGNPVVEVIPQNYRVLDGLFQALAVRSGGFYVVTIPQLYIGLQVLYVIMMYISVYPVVITMRHSNVYEERSLGIYANDEMGPYDPESTEYPPVGEQEGPSTAAAVGRAFRRTFTWHGVGASPAARSGPGNNGESRASFISQQIQGQLAHDIWWLVVAVLVISTIETSNWLGDPVQYSVFNILFEVVSAYGCVGISVGVKDNAYSFSGGLHAASKLVLCLVMIRGRHRGLPVALDRAVRLPGEGMVRDEEEDYRIRRSMTGRRGSTDQYVD